MPFLIGALFLSLLLRGFVGADNDDESYSLSLAYRFVLGDRPFVDDFSPHQGVGLLLWPLVKLWNLTFGNWALLLSTRTLFVLAWAAVGWGIYRTLRKFTGDFAALSAFAVWLSYVPFRILNFGYNTLGLALPVVASLLLLADTPTESRRGLHLAAAGSCVFFAAVAYFPLAGLLPLFLFVLVAETKRGRPAWIFLLGYVLPAAGFAFFFGPDVAAFFRRVREFPDIAQHATLVGIGSLVQSFVGLFSLRPPLWWGGPVVAAFFIPARRSRFILAWVLGLAFLVYCRGRYPGPDTGRAALLRILALNYVWLPVGWVAWRRGAVPRRLLWLGLFPAAGVGLAMGTASMNGYMNAGIGFFFTLVCLVAVATDLSFRRAREFFPGMTDPVRRAMCLIPAGLLIFFHVHDLWSGEEHFFAEDCRRIEGGPFAGLFALRATADRLQNVSDQLRRIEREARSACSKIVVLSGWPSGYLLTHCRPGVFLTWSYPFPISYSTFANRALQADLYRKTRSDRDLLLAVDETQTTPKDPFFALIAEAKALGYRELRTRKGYRLWAARLVPSLSPFLGETK